MAKKIWSYDETLIAFDLYFRVPWEKINARNPDIVRVAQLLGRTSAALSMKMDNIARLDQDVLARGFSSLTHGAILEQRIWDEFYGDRETLLAKIDALKVRMGMVSSCSREEILYHELPVGADKYVETKKRIGQKFFRMAVLSAYDEKCCITGIAIPNFLVASHIKPWRDATAEEKTNPHNGLCLNSLHDRAFDAGFITLDKQCRIVVSQKLKEHLGLDEVTKAWVIGYDGKEIAMPGKFQPDQKYLEYHRDVIFQK